MASPFVHLEVLGPRATVDQWLGVLQDQGGCHLADALAGLEGEAGILRPSPTPDEQRVATLRSEAGRLLRTVDRVLPPTASEEGTPQRPSWSVASHGEGEREAQTLASEAREVADRIRGALEEARRAEREVEETEGSRLAVRALEAAGESRLVGRAWLVPHDVGRPRHLLRALKKAELRTVAVEGPRETVVLALGADVDAGDFQRVATESLARPLAWGDDFAGLQVPEVRARLEEALGPARRRVEEATATLRRRITEDGPRARLLLDSLRDAERRAEAWKRLASTEHVVGARVFVRREDADALRRLLSVRFGREVVVRDLAPAQDEPALPRSAAGLPFGALDGMRPSRFGEVSTASLLALALPVVAGGVLADVGAGLLLLLVGGAIGFGAVVGSPRRDTALLAQLGGLVAFVLGILEGRAFGALGAELLGGDWGLAPGGALMPGLDPLRGLVVRMGGVALLLAVWGLICTLVNLRARAPARTKTAALGTLAFFVVAGGAALALPPDHVLRSAWIAAPVAGFLVLLQGGFRQGLGRLLLDLVGVLRLLAVGWIALRLMTWGFDALAVRPVDAFHVLLGPAAVLLAALTLAVDPAYVAMGVPYDLSLGARGLTEPFAPLIRVRGTRASGRRAG